jgi:hypothetical protein
VRALEVKGSTTSGDAGEMEVLGIGTFEWVVEKG